MNGLRKCSLKSIVWKQSRSKQRTRVSRCIEARGTGDDSTYCINLVLCPIFDRDVIFSSLVRSSERLLFL